jgi:hypothetical protein
MQRRFEKLTRIPQGVLADLHLPLRRRHQMRSPVDKGKRQGNRRYATGQARQHCMEGTVGLIGFHRLGLRSFESAPCGKPGPDDLTVIVAMTERLDAAGQRLRGSF